MKPLPAVRKPPNAALPPASENGVDATAVPNTLAVFGAPKAAKSVTTLRGGECEGVGMDAEEAVKIGEVGFLAGRYGV